MKFHDLHHVLTGYDTDFSGELEISAWEIGAGCKRYAAAWGLNLGGVAAGLFTCGSRVFASFVRGRRSATLYGEPCASLTYALLFVVATLGGLAVGLILLTLVLPLVPVGLITSWLRRRSRTGDVTA